MSLLFVTVTFAQNYNSTHTGAEIDAGVRPYKVYTALLTQTGTNNPVATVLENTLGGDVVWTRTNIGQYKYVLSNAHFDKTKTVFIGLSPMARNFIVIFWDDLNDPLGEFFLETYDNFSNSADELLNDFCFEIRVYP